MSGATVETVVSPRDVHVEVFSPPTREDLRLVRMLRDAVAPRDGVPTTATRAVGRVFVSPFTQLTFFNFELQAFQFRVFHRSLLAKLSHGVFMPAVVFFTMAFFAQFRGTLAGIPLSGSHAYALFLCLWYAGLAIRESFGLWWILASACTFALSIGADAYHLAFANPDPSHGIFASTDLAHSPLLGSLVSAVLVMLGHAGESGLPPRICDRWRWNELRDVVIGRPGAPISWRRRLDSLAKIAVQFLFGTFNEWWASPRLMQYSLLLLLFRLGYRRDRHVRLEDFVRRAVASGNPALDFVGIGGGAYLNAALVDPAAAAE